MAEREQVRPLAPASERTSSDDEETALQNVKNLKKRRCIKCCGCISAVLLIQAAVVLILIFTVFKIKDPIIRMNNVIITKIEPINATMPLPRPGSNMSITADISVKNPNYASFKYPNTTTTLFFHGTVIGDARGPPGKSKARRTTRMNITVDIIADKILSHPSLGADISSGLIAIDSYTIVGGRVKIINIIKKHVTVKMNCTVSINITTRAIQEQKCKRKVDL
ncbi:uncharacterized protein LOC111385605 [Olea europaea var. sylvestris]|uniref:Late embryogenesis abundant, LEA-14 n=1 Tax=Olea europaea subsp. europaea TaxID=158383 RepID=A0A8S0V8Z3_OLEEU|nr:uncharacterized protein LOC111385596 [Olea europaea var. sylvestris]XP_022865782.1 uncharacterized protein LOC111385605 [Olea europaea var. sylvestris]CAA3027407.1 Late embryogenesis abundant, LEA-14 [Olea europaea subsp. europaea]